MTPPNLVVSMNGGHQRFVAPEAVMIGRTPDNNVVVDNPVVSSRHLQIHHDGVSWQAIDGGSTNGTFVNGQRVPLFTIDRTLYAWLGGEAMGTQLTFSLEAVPDAPRGPIPSDSQFSTKRHTEIYSAPIAGAAVLIGRGQLRPDGRTNQILLTDLNCSRAHAELRSLPGGRLELIDSGSSNGTFVEGKRISRAELREGERVSMGSHVLRVVAGQLVVDEVSSDVSFAVKDLVVIKGKNKDGSPKTLLDHVSFSLPPKSFMAVLGPSGCGKSTLIKAISRTIGTSSGQVLFDNHDLFAHYDEFRRNIGYVPQDDIVHGALTPQRALSYAADLRFSAEVSAAERTVRINEVLAQFGLDRHRDTVISKLSGGQRKRVSVALELLTRPSVLMLDEPTSGLDPGYEKSVMVELRELSKQGRTVMVVTHSMQSLELCDRVLVLAKGGKLAYFGPPSDLLSYFKVSEYSKIFGPLETDETRDWAGEFARSPYYDRYVGNRSTGAPRVASVVKAIKPPRSRVVQLQVLLRRYVQVMLADKRNLVVLALQAPVIGLMLTLMSEHGLRKPENLPNARGLLALLSLVIAGTYLGASNAVREIVKELPIFERERAAGLSVASYVGSKAIVLGVITVVQSAILVVLATALAEGPWDGVLPLPPKLELIGVVALTGLAAMGIGLLVSAVVNNADKAMTALPVVLLAMYLLSGGPSDPDNMQGLKQMSWVNSARWGLSASASTARLRELNGCQGNRNPEAVGFEKPGHSKTPSGDDLTQDETPDPKEWNDHCVPSWKADLATWGTSMLMLTMIGAASLGAAGWALDQKQRQKVRK